MRPRSLCQYCNTGTGPGSSSTIHRCSSLNPSCCLFVPMMSSDPRTYTRKKSTQHSMVHSSTVLQLSTRTVPTIPTLVWPYLHGQLNRISCQSQCGPQTSKHAQPDFAGMQIHIECCFLITRLACSSPSTAAVLQRGTAVQPEGRPLHCMPVEHTQGSAPVCTSNGSLSPLRPPLERALDT
jgi:hypothetical protein